MADVITLPEEIWNCNCGCTTFFIHSSGKIECASCGKYTEDHASEPGQWVTRLPSVPDEMPTNAGTIRVTNFGIPELAKARVLKGIKDMLNSGELIAMFGYDKNGGGKHWIGTETQENKDTLIDKLETLLHQVREMKVRKND